MERQTFSQKLKQHFVKFLSKQINPPPLLFFTLYIYCHLQIQSPNYIAYTFFSVGLIFALLFSYNHFYIYSPILNGGIGYLSILNLALGLLAANEKWKLYLYLFIIGDSLTIEYPEITKLYTICCCLYLTIEIYQNLIFKTVTHNITFFVGFATIFIFELFRKLIQSVDGYSGIPYFTVPFAILIAYKLIKNRVQKLKKEDISKLRNVQLVEHYIKLMEQQIKSPYSREGFIQNHKENCSSVDCFCRNGHITAENNSIAMKIKFSTKMEYFFIRSLFEKVLALKTIPKKEFLYNKFIEFLIENNQITEAIEMYTKLENMQAKFYYFRWIERSRLYFKIRDKLEEFDYFNIFSKEFLYVFKYDHSYLFLASEIKEILKRKVSFWKQVGKQTPLMVKLQQLGSQIVQKMYDLNNFYYKDIKEQEEKINNFNGTIMYAMYLLSTTNYKEYAESLIKNTSRTLESIKIHEDNIAETYGVKVLISDAKKSCNQKILNIDQIIDTSELEKITEDGVQCYSSLSLQKTERQRSKKLVKFYEDGFIETITNISGSLCKILKTAKNDMLGKDLNVIIPASYQERHHKKLGKMLHYDNLSNKQIVNLSFVNKIREVPLKTADNKLITAKISVKIYEGIDEGISFIALVQTINENKVTLITNIEGEVQQYEEGLGNLKILECEEITNTLKELKEEWKTENKISSRKISAVYMDNNYSISFSSPYQVSFLFSNKDQLQETGESQDETRRLFSKSQDNVSTSPPIHIDIVNESIPYLVNPRQDREEEMTKCIKKMESVFYKTDIDSQASTNSSRKSSVVNVLMSFSENYFIPFYGYIMGVFALIVIGSIAANSIGYSQLGLAWNNSEKVKNPIVNILSIMELRVYMVCTVNHQLDLKEYRTNPLINKTNVNLFYGLDKTDYPTYVKQVTNRTKLAYKQAVSSVSMYVSDILAQKLNDIWNILVPTTNPNNPIEDKKTQNLPLQNIFMNYLVDLDLLSQGKPYSKTIISLNFWSTIDYILSKCSSLNSLVTDSIDKSVVLNYLYCGITIAVLFFTIIPIYVLLKKRVKRHIDIYDLIVSVEGELIRQEIKKLDNIVTIVNNSNESSQVLKTNTINYLARKRSSALNDNVGGSNEMIEGLIEHNNNDSINQAESTVLEESDTKNGFLPKKSSKMQSYLNSKAQDEIVGEQSKKLVLRKRSGELDLKDSEGDSKKIIIKHLILYIIVVLSPLTLLLTTISKTEYYSLVKNSFISLEAESRSFIEEGLIVLNSKLFFRGMPSTDFQYHDQNYTDWMQSSIYSNTPLLFNSRFSLEEVNPPCTDDNQNKYFFCQRNYSLISLREQQLQFAKQAYEKRLQLNQKYNITANNQTSVPQNELQNMSEYFFYVQSMRDRISNFSTVYRNSIVSEMFDGQVQLNEVMGSIFVAGLSFGVLCLFLGICLVNHMKKLYFKEIIIVSFLNNEMISKNKRVESFLETLSKSSY